MSTVATTIELDTIPGMKQDFREIIHKRMKQLKWGAYQLAEACHAMGLSRQTVHPYLAGKRETNTAALKVMFTALGLKVVPGAKPKKRPTRAKDPK